MAGFGLLGRDKKDRGLKRDVGGVGMEAYPRGSHGVAVVGSSGSSSSSSSSSRADQKGSRADQKRRERERAV